MLDAETNRKVVQGNWDAFNRGDMNAAAGFFAEDTRNHGRPVGRAGVLAVLKDIRTTFTSLVSNRSRRVSGCRYAECLAALIGASAGYQ